MGRGRGKGGSVKMELFLPLNRWDYKGAIKEI